MITDILHTDNEFDDLSNTDRKKQRQAKLQQKVDAYFEWVKLKYTQVTHNSTISRKNFVLMESDNGAKASAMPYSLVETAKVNGVSTYQYLELLLTEIPRHMDDGKLNFLDELLPWYRRNAPAGIKRNKFSRYNTNISKPSQTLQKCGVF